MIMNLHISLVITIYMGVYIYNIKSNIETKTLNTNEKLNMAVMRNQ